MNSTRPSRVIVDLGALRHNIRLVRDRIGSSVRFYAVCKGDAYGCGVAQVARVCAQEKVDALAVGDASDAISIRAAGVTLPILAYGCSDPQLAAPMAQLELTVTIFDLPGLAAFGAVKAPVDAWLELDCGFGRLGFTSDQFGTALAALREYSNLRIRGFYTHLGAVDEAAVVARQMTLFERMIGEARSAGYADAETMVASSRVIAAFPHLALSAVNPGRALYGLLEGRYAQLLPVQQVVRAVESRVIQVKEVAPEMRVGYGGADPRAGSVMRTAVVPLGFADGFPRHWNEGYALVRGRRARIVGLMSMEHTVLDVTDIADASVGDSVVFQGDQGDKCITPAELARMTGFEVIDILPRLARGLPREYVDESPRRLT